MSRINSVPETHGNVQVEQLKESVKLEIRRELKIKEGAENLRKVSTDKKILAQTNQAIKQSNVKLQELHERLQELNAHIKEDIIKVGKNHLISVTETKMRCLSCGPTKTQGTGGWHTMPLTVSCGPSPSFEIEGKIECESLSL